MRNDLATVGNFVLIHPCGDTVSSVVNLTVEQAQTWPWPRGCHRCPIRHIPVALASPEGRRN